jgi:mono/diheme cytochrome c family protein
MNCAGCHGDASRRSQWGATGFYQRVPQFAESPPRKPDWQMFWIVKNGVRYSGMRAWRHLASDREIWQAVTFLSRLRDLPPAVASEWRKPGRAQTQLATELRATIHDSVDAAFQFPDYELVKFVIVVASE